MKIILVEKTITRDYYEQLVSVVKKNVGNYFSDHIPRVGEIIWFKSNNYYDVCEVIHTVHNDVIIEVTPHSNRQYYDGKYPHFEDIPLVTQMESNSWIPENIDR